MKQTFKIQKVLAECGLGSRRTIEKWIEAGRVKVNGEVAAIGTRITQNAKITFDNQPVNLYQSRAIKTRVLAYHKPVGEVCSQKDTEGRRTAYEALPPLKQGRWIMVGRLDINTSGLLLFTNDGALANRLMHPSSEVERCYAVRVLGQVTPDMIKKLKSGVELEDGLAQFKKIKFVGGDGANQWYEVVLTEGRNREVRRMWEAQGVRVSRLIRVAYGPIRLARYLRPKQWRELSDSELRRLQA